MPDLRPVRGNTYSLCTSNTEPLPPNFSFPQPKKTFRIPMRIVSNISKKPIILTCVPICRNAEAHIIHGSTVTYRSVSLKIEASFFDSISSIASNSACLVAYVEDVNE